MQVSLVLSVHINRFRYMLQFKKWLMCNAQ